MAQLELQVKGEVVKIGTTESFGKLTQRSKQKVVVAVLDGGKTQYLPIDFYDSDTEQIPSVTEGDMVNLKFKCCGFESNSNYYPSYHGLVIERLK